MTKTASKAPEQTTETPAVGKSVVFRDLAFKSRVLFWQGKSWPVSASRIETSDPGMIAWLEKNREFRREEA
ncbi:MAG: hypothetical protein LBO79_02915 [Zoogloeaceae bacterium]|jgi:hypothetical protein|nr:hypothetical protein [Zoogloeaceae bacterium]